MKLPFSSHASDFRRCLQAARALAPTEALAAGAACAAQESRRRASPGPAGGVLPYPLLAPCLRHGLIDEAQALKIIERYDPSARVYYGSGYYCTPYRSDFSLALFTLAPLLSQEGLQHAFELARREPFLRDYLKFDLSLYRPENHTAPWEVALQQAEKRVNENSHDMAGYAIRHALDRIAEDFAAHEDVLERAWHVTRSLRGHSRYDESDPQAHTLLYWMPYLYSLPPAWQNKVGETIRHHEYLTENWRLHFHRRTRQAQLQIARDVLTLMVKLEMLPPALASDLPDAAQFDDPFSPHKPGAKIFDYVQGHLQTGDPLLAALAEFLLSTEPEYEPHKAGISHWDWALHLDLFMPLIPEEARQPLLRRALEKIGPLDGHLATRDLEPLAQWMDIDLLAETAGVAASGRAERERLRQALRQVLEKAKTIPAPTWAALSILPVPCPRPYWKYSNEERPTLPAPPPLSSDGGRQALEAVLNNPLCRGYTGSENKLVEKLAELTLRLPDELRLEVFEMVRAFDKLEYRLPGLAWLSPYLPDEQRAWIRQYVWQETRTLWSQGYHRPLLGQCPLPVALLALSRLASELSAAQLEWLLSKLKQVPENDYPVTSILLNFAPFLAPELAVDAWAYASHLSKLYYRLAALGALLPCLPESALRLAAQPVWDLPSIPLRLPVLALLAQRSPGEVRRTSLKLAADTLHATIHLLTDGFEYPTGSDAQTISYTEWLLGLQRLAPLFALEGEQNSKIADWVLAAPTKYRLDTEISPRMCALLILLPHLPLKEQERVLGQIFVTGKDADAEEARWQEIDLMSLNAWLPGWTWKHPENAWHAWEQLLEHLAAQPPGVLYDRLRCLLPFALSLGGKEQVREAAEVLLKVI